MVKVNKHKLINVELIIKKGVNSMKFVDELYNFYKDKLIADEEDVDLLIYSIMQDLSREEMLRVLSELNDNELYQITGSYLAFKLKEKIIQDQNLGSISDDNKYLN